MCRVLDLPRSTYYYEATQKPDESELIALIKKIFKESRNNYGTRKIKKVANVVDRKFNSRDPLGVVVSDLTYVRVVGQWNYICVLIDLFNREIIGYSAGKNKDVQLVSKAFSSIKHNLSNINIFHTDRGNEFKNQLIDETLETFDIARSLSKKGCPYDNAVAEATFKIIKTEFVRQYTFDNLNELNLELFDYVNWFNNRRIHSSLNYLTPKEYRDIHLKKVV